MELPHRAPALLLDRVDGDVAYARMPDDPAWLVEVCAQACAALHGGGAAGVLLGVMRFELRALPAAGAELAVRVTLKGGDARAVFHATVDEGRVAEGDLAVARG